MNDLSRRDFMKSAAVFSTMALAPQFLTRTAHAAAQSVAGFKDDRVLVVVQLSGGNDGLNALVPYADDAYYRARPNLGLKQDRLIKLDDYLAFNDRLDGFANLYDDGKLAVVQGVGYPNPDRSHFRSMEIWHTASDSDEFVSSGWIGRYFDNNCSGAARPQVGVAVGKERPQAFTGDDGYGVAFENPYTFGWQPGEGGDSEENFKKLNEPDGPADDNLDFLRHVTSNAILSSHEVKEAAQRVKFRGGGNNRLGRQLEMVAALIRGQLETRIFFVSAGGFDTHAGQLGQHDNLLGQIGSAIHEFQARLQKDGTADRVVTMVFSEFGRRVDENYSGGTDHGTAAPMFFIGDTVKPGLHGAAPSLSDLDDGDLKFTTDFRRAYATVLDDWFHVDAGEVLGNRFKNLPLIA